MDQAPYNLQSFQYWHNYGTGQVTSQQIEQEKFQSVCGHPRIRQNALITIKVAYPTQMCKFSQTSCLAVCSLAQADFLFSPLPNPGSPADFWQSNI